MIAKETIIELLEKHLQERGDLFLVEVKTTPDNKIKVLIESKERLALDDCVAVSKWLEGQLDREVEDFELEVSSAGVGRPFKVREQYEKAIGKQVEVKCEGGEKYNGLLKELQEDAIVLITEKRVVVEGKKKKQTVEKAEKILLEDIITTKEIITF